MKWCKFVIWLIDMWACFYCPISKILYFFRSDDVNDVQEVINKESILPLLAAATTITTRFNTMTCTITCPSHVCGQLFSLLVVVDHVLPYENQITWIFMGRCPLLFYELINLLYFKNKKDPSYNQLWYEWLKENIKILYIHMK